MLSAEQLETVAGLATRARHTFPEGSRPDRDAFQFSLARSTDGVSCTLLLPVDDPRSELPLSIEIEVGRGGDCDDRYLTSVERAVAQAALPAARAA